MNHKITQENDEFACTCGLRWDVNEQDPHPSIQCSCPLIQGGCICGNESGKCHMTRSNTAMELLLNDLRMSLQVFDLAKEKSDELQQAGKDLEAVQVLSAAMAGFLNTVRARVEP